MMKKLYRNLLMNFKIDLSMKSTLLSMTKKIFLKTKKNQKSKNIPNKKFKKNKSKNQNS